MLATLDAVTEDAPAKINLALHVTGRRADGYHLLESLVVFTEFGDRIEVAEAAKDAFSVNGPFGDHVPADAGNLVLRARDAFRAFDGPTKRSVSINLTKNLPIASGVGGGSSDAAATLKALNRLWGSGLTEAQLAEIGLPLGADLPMCLAVRPLIARGIGEKLEPLGDFPALDIVLVNPGVAVSTPQVFKALASPDNPPLPVLHQITTFAALVNWLKLARNDMEAAARSLAPPIGDALNALTSQRAAFSRMSGSGSTCFGLFSSAAAAQSTAEAIRAAQPGWFVVATETRAS